MANHRRPLTEGLKTTSTSQIERDFVYQNATPSPSAAAATPTAAQPIISRAPVSVRMRTDYAAALKRASLERQLQNIVPNRLQDILEEALVPWLKSNGYLD